MTALDAPGWGGIGLLAFLFATGLLVIFKRTRRLRLRRRHLSTGFTPEERGILERDFPRYRRFPEALQTRFEGYTRVLMEEKNFEACGGLSAVTPEMKLLISAQAAMLLLGIPRHGFYPLLKSILVYSGAFRDRGRRRFDLREAEDRGILLGESWESGSVVLSWNSVLAGGRNEDDGVNVVIHEFAHQLDQMNGDADGVPMLPDREAYARWANVFGRHYETLVEETDGGTDDISFLDPYGATDPSEFFAVVSETFFEESSELNREHPELYRELSLFYGLDPASW